MKTISTFLLMVLLMPTAVRAEFFIDAFGGIANTRSGSFTAMRQDVDLIHDDTIVNSDGGDLSGSTSPMIGLRGG